MRDGGALEYSLESWRRYSGGFFAAQLFGFTAHRRRAAVAASDRKGGPEEVHLGIGRNSACARNPPYGDG